MLYLTTPNSAGEPTSPTTTIFPSVCIATAFAILSPEPETFVVTIPPVPKVASNDPFAL